jgi:predicted porin
MGNFDYGKEGDVTWWGIAAYAKLQATPDWAVVGRYEYLDDTDGGFMTFSTKAQTITVTSDHTIAGAFKARFEYRTDFADEDIFTDDEGSAKGSQTTLTVGLVYSFGGGLF